MMAMRNSLSLISSILIGILCAVGSYRVNSRIPTKSIYTRLYAGGQVPLVPYYPNKVFWVYLYLIIKFINYFHIYKYRIDDMLIGIEGLSMDGHL